MTCKLDRKCDDYMKCNNCPYLDCPDNKLYIDRIKANKSKKRIGRIVSGFTTKAYYKGKLVSIDINPKNGCIMSNLRIENHYLL